MSNPLEVSLLLSPVFSTPFARLHDGIGDQHYRLFSRKPSTATLCYVAFGEEVRRRRRAARLTLEQLAEKANLSANYVGSIENGVRDPSLSTVMALAKGLKVPAAELLGGLQELGPMGLEAGRLLEAATPEVQEAILGLLRAVSRRRR